MAVLIGHASGDERGKLSGGSAGDQTKKEVTTRNWYNRPWTVVIRFIDDDMAERNAVAMEHACANDNIGYDQNQRNTLFKEAKKYNYDPGKVTQKVETDCSALVALCAMYAGIPEKTLYRSGNSASTHCLREWLEPTKKVKIFTSSKYTKSSDYLLRGDILLYPGHHTAIALSDGAKATPRKKKETVATTLKPVSYFVRIKVNALNVRKGAGTSNPIIGTVLKNDYVYISKEDNGWGYTGLGWISLKSDYVNPVGGMLVGFVTASRLNVRDKSSSVTGNVKTVLKQGTQVFIECFNADNTWGKDTLTGGWVNLQYINLQ